MGKVAGLTGTDCMGPGEGSVHWPFSSAQSRQFRVGLMAKFMVPEAPPENSRATSRSKGEEEWSELYARESRQLATGWTAQDSSPLGHLEHLRKQRQWCAQSWRRGKGRCAGGRLGSLGSPHIAHILISRPPDQSQTPLISGADHFNIMAGCSDVQVSAGPQ